jgi:CheY-like chemotaxis protein
MTKVLYVEDEALLAISMESILVESGYIVALAHDGEEGVARALSFLPQVIVTDFMMPRMDGPAMLKELLYRGIKVPVVLTTAVPEEDITAEVRCQIDIYLPKPFSEQDLIAAVNSLSALSSEPH